MSLIVQRTISTFRNPVLQQIDAEEFVEGQRIPVDETIFALAIAADSDVDLMRVHPRTKGRGRPSYEDSFVVAAGVPWIGRIDPLEVAELVCVPVRAVEAPDGATRVGDCAVALWPRCKVDLYTQDAPPLPPAGAAPGEWTYAEQDVDSNVAVERWCPLIGRTTLGVHWLTTGFTGAMVGGSPTMTIDLVGYVCADDGTLSSVTKSTSVAKAADALGEFYQDCAAGAAAAAGWPHWTHVKLSLAGGAAGTLSYRIRVGAR